MNEQEKQDTTLDTENTLTDLEPNDDVKGGPNGTGASGTFHLTFNGQTTVAL
jgi:hypothetical protein